MTSADVNPYAPPPALPSEDPVVTAGVVRTVTADDASFIRQLARTLRFVGIGWCVVLPLSMLSGVLNGTRSTVEWSAWFVFSAGVTLVPILAQGIFLAKAGRSLRRSVRRGHANERALMRAVAALKVVFVLSTIAGLAGVLVTHVPRWMARSRAALSAPASSGSSPGRTP